MNFFEVALSQETSDLAKTSDYEIFGSNSIASIYVVLDSSTEGRAGGSRSLQQHHRYHSDHHNQHGR